MLFKQYPIICVITCGAGTDECSLRPPGDMADSLADCLAAKSDCCGGSVTYMGPSDARRIGDVTAAAAGELNPPADAVLDSAVALEPPPESWSLKGAAAAGGRGCGGGAATEALCGRWCIGGDCM